MYKTLFLNLKKTNSKAYMPYVMLGYPTLEESYQIAKTLLDAGAHGLEIGLPFSDPLADGPTIQQAGQEALQNGFKVKDGLPIIKRLREEYPHAPFTLMCYYNMLVAKGVDVFIADMAAAGISGILIPDLPPEAAAEVKPVCEKNGVELVLIVSSLSDAARLELIQKYAGGFLYVVSRLGITGTEERYDEALQNLMQRIHDSCDLPAIVGFGISAPEHAKAMINQGADGVITGSRIIQMRTDYNSLKAHTQSMVQAVSA